MKFAYAAFCAATTLIVANGVATAQVIQDQVVSGTHPYFPNAETMAKVKDAGTYRVKGVELLQQGKADAALAEFDKAREIWPEGGLEIETAEAYTLKGDDAAAIDWYRKIIYPPPGYDKSQTDPMQLMHYAIVLNRAGQREEAVSVYNRALHYLPNFVPKNKPPLDIAIVTPQYDGKLFEAAARIAIVSTGYPSSDEEAMKEINTALRLQPRLGIAHYYKALILASQPSKSQEAAAEFAQAVQHRMSLRSWVQKSLTTAPKSVQEAAATALVPKSGG